MLALTATALPRVQQDIFSSLLLRVGPGGDSGPDLLIARGSCDRPNLSISAYRKPATGGVGQVRMAASTMCVVGETDRDKFEYFGYNLVVHLLDLSKNT